MMDLSRRSLSVLLACMALLPGAALAQTDAQARPDTRAMTCAEAAALVARAGAIVMSTGPATYARFIDALQLFTRLVNIGDAKSLACHPASTTHRQLTDPQRIAAGAGPEVVRLSVGLEGVDDLLGDLDHALG